MSKLWERIRNDLIWDGSLRDIYIKKTTLEDWDQFLKVVQSTVQHQYFIDGQTYALSPAVDIFTTRATKLLSISLGKIQLNCHFFTEFEIELDLDPREVNSEENFNTLSHFMEQLAVTFQKPILFTPENLSDYPIAKYDPASRAWHYFSPN